jgi:heme-degrading monooxygenase HmoA
MIIREWRGRASPDRADAYPEHFRRTVLPELRGVPGFLGAMLCHGEQAGRIEYLVLTRWQSMEAIRAFAGAEPGKAVVEPGAAAALVDFDEFVRHYEVIDHSDNGSSR